MRNLKKILAMALALVMSLSLMATAGAANFKDADSINDKYETAIEVLEGLGVFKGYQDGTFQPNGSITRAETAAIIYRIVTGDVKDEQVGIYADYNLFSDVPSTSWYAGYVNFCANAEYIKGVGGGKFDPNSQVTGYAALAMILRAIGYTANGGFTGSDWEVQTARTAESRRITKNILTGTLGQPASRETVAEILFQAILVNMVDHNVDNTYNGNQGYTEIDMTLGYKTFKLEEIEGVVTGNEFADLKTPQVLDEGETQLETEDGVRDLAISTKITDIGESRYAYITGSKVLAMGDTGLNKITEFGHACEIDTTTKFNAAAEMPAASGIEYYVNFDRVGTYTCDQRLEFQVTFQTAVAEASFNAYINNVIADIAANETGWTRTWTGGVGVYPVTYNKVIRANEDITDDDLDVLRGIFGAADNAMNNGLNVNQITGDVFVGTMSTNSTTTNEERDLSNSISYNKFFADYINDVTYNQNWNSSVNGAWVKFVDNNGDGKAEYAFRTDSWLDEAIDTYTNKDGDTVTAFVTFNDDDTRWVDGWTKVRYMDGEAPAVGTKVICAWIDNQILVEPAGVNNVTVSDYNWRTDVITTDKGDLGQSGIQYADLGLQYFINTMDMKTEYIVYLDHFGYVRAYELPGDVTYALVTEIYARNNMNGALEQSWPMTVELTIKDADATEYGLNGGNRNPFVSPSWWTQINNYSAVGNYYNYLKPAVAHLGVPAATGFGPTLASGVVLGASYTFWDRYRQVAYDVNDMVKNDTFDYGPVNGRPTTNAQGAPINVASTSFTNVAVARIDGENATLEGAAKLRLDGRGDVMRWDSNGDGVITNADKARYSVDYVQLTTADTVKGQTRYPIDTVNYTGWIGNTTNDVTGAGNHYVSATHDTEYYLAYNGDVYYFTDYVNMPKLTMADNVIHAAYAVARDVSADNANEPYWVADVIVYEIQKWVDTNKTSTALVYYNPSRNDQQIQRLNVLDSVNGKVDAIPAEYGWNANLGYFNNFANYAGLGFYQFWDGVMQENGDLAVDSIVHIDGIDHRTHTSATVHADGNTCDTAGADLRWNSNLIYAGTVVNEVDVATNGTYLNVDTDGDGNTNVSLLVKASSESNVYSVTTDGEVGSRWNYNEANALRYNNIQTSEIKAGDRIVWVGASAINVVGSNNTQSASFVVDLGNGINNQWIYGNTAAFLGRHPAPTLVAPNPNPVATTLWADIMTEQGATKTTNSITIEAVELPDGSAGDNDVLNITVAPAAIALNVETQAITFANLGDYAIDSVTVTNVIGGDPAATAATVGDVWTLFDIKGDVELKITLKDVVDTFTVTLKGTAGTTNVEQAYEIPADGSKTIDLTEAPFVVRGYTLNAVADSGTAATGAILTVTPGGTPKTQVVVTNPTASGEIDLTYAAGTYSLEAENGTTGAVNAAAGLTDVTTINYSIAKNDDSGDQTGTLTLDTAIGADAKYADADYTITFTGNPLYTYTATATAGTATISRTGNNWTITGKITGTTVVSIAETLGETAKVMVAAGGTTLTGLTNNGDVLADTAKTITVAPSDADHKVSEVSYQISGQPAVKYTADSAEVEVAANGTWTVSLPAAAFVSGKTTTVSATEIDMTARTLTFTVTYTGTGLEYSLNGGRQTAIANNGTVSVKPGDVLVITSNAPIDVTKTAATSANWGGAADPIVAATNNLSVTVTIDNVSGAIGLTIANKT